MMLLCLCDLGFWIAGSCHAHADKDPGDGPEKMSMGNQLNTSMAGLAYMLNYVRFFMLCNTRVAVLLAQVVCTTGTLPV